MGITREIHPDLEPIEFPDYMDAGTVDAYIAENRKKLVASLASRRRAQLAAETEGDEALGYRMGQVPLEERVGSTLMAAPQAAARQTGQTLRGFGEFLANSSIPSDPFETDPTIAEENIRRFRRTPQQVEQEVEAVPIRQAGTRMVAAAPETFPTLPGVRESLPSQVSSGVGSVAALMPAGLTGPAAPFVAGGMYGLSAGEDFADDADRVINGRIAEALAQGDTATAADLERRKFDMKNTARTAGRVIGAGTEGLLGVAGKIRVGKASVGGIGERLAERLIPGAQTALKARARNAIEGAITESTQEATEQLLGNAAARAVYDPNRKITEDVLQSALVGGLTGGAVAAPFRGRRDGSDPLPASREAAMRPGPAPVVPEDINAPDLTIDDVGDMFGGVPEVTEATPAPVSEVPATETTAVDSAALSPATVAETPTPSAPSVTPEPVSTVEGATGSEQQIRKQDAKLFSQWQSTVEAAMDPMADSLHEANAKTVIPALQKKYPGVLFISPGQLPAYLNQTMPAPVKPKRTRKAKVAPVVALTPQLTPPDDTAMEAATAAAVAPGVSAPVTKAPDEGIAERAAADAEMTRATTRVPEAATVATGAPEDGIQRGQEIPPLPTELAEAIAADEAPDVFVENAVRKFGEGERASAQSTKPTDAQREIIAKGKRIAAEKGLDWNRVKETARRQLGLNENFLRPDSRADQIFQMMRKEDADAAKRGQRTADEMARIDAETKARKDKEATDKAEKEAAQRKQSEEKAAEIERQTVQEHDQIVAKLPKKWMASWKKAKTKKAKAKLLNEAMVASGTRNDAALTAALDRAQEPAITEAPAEPTPQAAKPQPDIIQRALDAAIKATDRGTATFSDPFLIAAVGLPTLNAALRLVRRVYLKTRDLVRAKRQGMRLIRRQLRTDPKADVPKIEAAFNRLVDDGGLQEGTQPGQIESFQASDGSRRQKSRGLFKGDVTVDTDAEWQAGAERWIAQFNGNIRRAFEAARSTDYATTGLNPAAQNYVFGRLLEMSEIAINAARNDVDMVRNINLQKEITDASRDSAAEAAKALGSRALVQNRLLWLYPILDYRKLINEAQKRLPFPDVVADEVRAWLQKSGQQAVQEMRNAMTDADKVFARELKTTVRDMRVVWRDVMTASVESQEASRRKILEELVKSPELKGLSRQGYIDIANLLGKAWEKERARIFAAEFRKQVPLPSVKEDVRRKLFTAIPDILKWANLGLLDNEAFRNAVAPKFGVAKFDGETAKKLNEMAQEAQKVGGVNRRIIIEDMYRLMQTEGGVRWQDLLRDYWYAAVLTALDTQVDNVMGIINGQMLTAMGMAMAKPEVRRMMGKAYTDGFAEAVRDFWPILTKGEYARSINFNQEQPNNTLEAVGASRNRFKRMLQVGKYTSRFMEAINHINALSVNQSVAAWALSNRFPMEHVQRYMMPSEQVRQNAIAKAQAENTPADLMNKRVREIIQESIPVEVLLSAKEISDIAGFTNKPYGLLGIVYEMLNKSAEKLPGLKLLTGTSFARFAFNAFNQSLNLVAPVALYRYYHSQPGRQDGPRGLKFGQEHRKLILAQAAFGTALATFAAALFLGDDDDEKDRFIDINGSFKSLPDDKRKQLLSEGRLPYSIRIGNKYVSYRQLPFGAVLSAIGELRDRQLYAKKEWDQESILRKFGDGMAAGVLTIKDAPAISSFTEFLGVANAYKFDPNDQLEKTWPRYLARLSGSFIPRALKQVDAWADPSIYKANTGHEFFLQQMPFGRRALGEGPVLNVLGEPVQVERYPWSRWIRTRKEDKAWSTLGELASKGVFLPVPAATVTVLENGKRREMTPRESYQYQQRVGKAYRKFVEENSEQLLRMKPDEANKFIKKRTEQIRERARLT